jgi:hypothetical protein
VPGIVPRPSSGLLHSTSRWSTLVKQLHGGKNEQPTSFANLVKRLPGRACVDPDQRHDICNLDHDPPTTDLDTHGFRPFTLCSQAVSCARCTYRDANPNTYANSDDHSHADRHGHGNADWYTDSDTDQHVNGDTDRHIVRDAYRNAD